MPTTPPVPSVAPRQVIGIVVYEHRGGELVGRWTVDQPAYTGKTGGEHATGGCPGELPGSYAVTITDAEGEPIDRGELDVEAVGETFALAWKVGSGTYRGLGLRAGEGRLAASYWKV